MQVTPEPHKSHVVRNVAAVVIVALLLGSAVVVYSYTRLSGTITSVSYGGLTWAQPSLALAAELGVDLLSGNYLGAALSLVTGIDVNAQLAVTNGGLVPVSIPTETHELIVNGIDLGGGSTNISQTVGAGQTVDISVQQTIDTALVTELASTIVSSGGNLNIEVKGDAHFSVVGIPLSIPFDKTSQVSLVQEIEQHIQSLVTGQSTQQQNQYNGNPTGSGSTIVSGEYNVSPGTYTSIPFTLASASTITGTFSATATLGNNIIVYVLDQTDYLAYQNGQSFTAYYSSGKVASGSINVMLGSGTYYIVLDNTYSTFSTKDVTIQVSTS